MSSTVIGVVGGSGLYDLDGLTDQKWVKVTSPFGEPSDELLFGRIGAQPIVFLPRHGRGHRIPPHEINYAANVDALKRAGATSIVSVSAVGSLREDLPPGTFVIADQFVDRTLRKPKTFFGKGVVGHVSMAHPTCSRIAGHVHATGTALGLSIVRGGTYVVMEGPQFSSLAESELHRSWKASVIGMTAMPEAKLAREAEICYATIAMVTDFDCWHPDHDHVDVAAVVAVMRANAEHVKQLVSQVVPRIGADAAPCPAGCDRALETAIMTAPEARDPELCQRLDAVAGRVLRRGGSS